MLAYDMLKGLFLYQINILPSPSEEVFPSLIVELVGVHSMAYSMQEETSETPARTRGFVTTCCLGPQGRRGIWVERSRGTMRRSVVAFSAFCIVAKEDHHGGLGGQVVYESTSYDLRGMFLVESYSL